MVVVVVGAAAVAVDAEDPVEADEPLVVDDVEPLDPEAVVPVDEPPVVDDVEPVDAGAEWATVSEATSTPSPAAPVAATIPMAAVMRRTLTMARSRANPAERPTEGSEPADWPEWG